jgi:hypothetical protein
MLERATLQVLADLVEVGLPEAVEVALVPFDPFLRGAIRRRVRAAVDVATERAASGSSDHVLRLAFVLAHPDRPKVLDPEDIIAVGEAYRRLSAPFAAPPAQRTVSHGPGGYRAPSDPHAAAVLPVHPIRRRSWPVTTPLAALLALATLSVALFYIVPHFTPTEDERFRRSPLGKSLGEPLTDWVSAERTGGAQAAKAKGLLVTPKVRKQIGPEAAGSLERLIDLIPETAASPARSVDQALAPLFETVNALNGELADNDVPALLHAYGGGDPGKRSVWVTSYFVQKRSETTLENEMVRVAWGRRIDSLNLLDTTLYKGDAEDWVILSLDRIEENFDETLLPAIARGGPLGPEEYDASDTSPRAELARTAGKFIAGELTATSRLVAEDAQSVYRALVTRNEATRDLAKLGYPIQPTSRLQLSPWLVRLLTEAKENNRDHAPLIEEMLRTNERMGLYRKEVGTAVEQLALIEEELFVDRLLDGRRLVTTHVPALADYGIDEPWVRVVLSSQLETLARPHDCPRLALWHVASLAYEKGYAPAYYGVTRLLFDQLFKKLEIAGLPDDEDAHPTSPFFAKGMNAALQMPPDRVRDAAARVYQDVFGHMPPSRERRLLVAGKAKTSGH